MIRCRRKTKRRTITIAAKFFFLAFVLFLTLGCSRYNIGIAPLFGRAPERASEPSKASKSPDRNLPPPLSVQVRQVFVDPLGKLHVGVHVTAKTDIDSKGVIVALHGLKEGELLHYQAKSLHEVHPVKTIKAGQTVSLRFEMDSSELSEYQVQCDWGQEDSVSKLLSTNKSEQSTEVTNERHLPNPSDNNLPKATLGVSSKTDLIKLTNMMLTENPTQCAKEPCGRFFTVHAEIKNGGQHVIDEVNLALRLVWNPDGQKPLPRSIDEPIGTDEELIKLETMGLKPGKSRKIRIKVDRLVPVLPGGRFIPQLRMVKSESKSN